MEVTIQKSKFDEIKPLIGPAYKEGLRIRETDGTVWFTAKVNGEVVGLVSCIVRERQRKAIFKRGFVLQDYRRKGIYNKLFEERLNYVKENQKIKVITALCTKESIHCFLKHGFKINRKHSRKYTSVLLRLK
ncbi:GNAT family N-acetyltransferase [Cytobacillus sp. FJAT-54145]|uniref:GNAT family N-acetyltransferase n=1 Tax=Cytobacillus spartinae TaxID=3299023 RepID=A0ABW6K4V0_9BACI